jgi:hypothetical protein
MPLQYTVDPAKRLVISNDTAPLTPPEIRQFFRDLSADPRFHPNFNQLHHMQAGALAAMHYNDLASVKEFDPFSQTSLRAIIVESEVDYGMVRMYELLRGGSMRVFRSEREAREFLGLGPGGALPSTA